MTHPNPKPTRSRSARPRPPAPAQSGTRRPDHRLEGYRPQLLTPKNWDDLLDDYSPLGSPDVVGRD